MNTFLPFSCFVRSVKILDNRRLGKQRVECKQIITILEAMESFPNARPAWRNHPATKMWKGHTEALKLYANACIAEWVRRGNKNTIPLYKVSGTHGIMVMSAGFLDSKTADFVLPLIRDFKVNLPWWFGKDEFHLSHQGNLVRKLPEHYRKYFPCADATLPYYWPTEHEEDKPKCLTLSTD